MTTNRKATRAELELKITEQEKLIEEQVNKLEGLLAVKEALQIENDKLDHYVAVMERSNKKLSVEFQKLFTANVDLSEKINELQTEVNYQEAAVYKLKRDLELTMQNFYWSPITLKKDINNIIND